MKDQNTVFQTFFKSSFFLFHKLEIKYLKHCQHRNEIQVLEKLIKQENPALKKYKITDDDLEFIVNQNVNIP